MSQFINHMLSLLWLMKIWTVFSKNLWKKHKVYKLRHLQHLTFLTKFINSYHCVFWWLRRVGARGQEVPFLFWSQLLQRAALLCWLCFSSCQHYLEERVFFFPTQEAYYLDDLRGQSRTSLGAPDFATADAELWVHCAETIPERPFLPQCVHTYMIIV